MAKIAKEIDEKFGGLPQFAQAVWERSDGVAHGSDEDAKWVEIGRVCMALLGEEKGAAAAALLKERDFFSIVFPD